jgi:hypothetical protein
MIIVLLIFLFAVLGAFKMNWPLSAQTSYTNAIQLV